MRTMPAVAMSSVDVVSTARAQRMQRRTWTEATGAVESMAKVVVDEAEDDESESQLEEDEEAELSPAGMMRERRGREVWLVNAGIWTIL